MSLLIENMSSERKCESKAEWLGGSEKEDWLKEIVTKECRWHVLLSRRLRDRVGSARQQDDGKIVMAM